MDGTIKMDTIETPFSCYMRQDGYFDDHKLIRDIGRDKANTALTIRERYELYLKKRHECGEPIGLLSDVGNVGDTRMVFSVRRVENVVVPWPPEDNEISLAKLIVRKFRPSITIVEDNCFRVRIRDDSSTSILPSPLPDTSPFIKEEASLYEYKYKEMFLEGSLSQTNHLYEFLHGIDMAGRGMYYDQDTKRIKRIRFLNQIQRERHGQQIIRFFVWLEDLND